MTRKNNRQKKQQLKQNGSVNKYVKICDEIHERDISKDDGWNLLEYLIDRPKELVELLADDQMRQPVMVKSDSQRTAISTFKKLIEMRANPAYFIIKYHHKIDYKTEQEMREGFSNAALACREELGEMPHVTGPWIKFADGYDYETLEDHCIRLSNLMDAYKRHF